MAKRPTPSPGVFAVDADDAVISDRLGLRDGAP
jgi:hypothetical protein